MHLDGCSRGRVRLLRCPTRLDRTPSERAREPSLRALAGPQNGSATSRALSPEAGCTHHPGARPFPAHPATPQQLLWRAEKAGLHIGQLCRLLHDRQGEPAVRRILGVVSLAKKHGLAAVEEACIAALEMSVPDYRFVRCCLERGPQLPLTLRQIDPPIRELVQYRGFG